MRAVMIGSVRMRCIVIRAVMEDFAKSRIAQFASYGRLTPSCLQLLTVPLPYSAQRFESVPELS